MEFLLSDELANPHSRRIKQKRWQSKIEDRKGERARILARHVADRLRGQSVKDAKAEAEWKFKQLVQHQDKEVKKRRWIQGGGLLRILAKKQRKSRKANALIRRMKSLQLDATAKNQVIPPAMMSVEATI